METKQIFAGKMILIKVDLCTRRKRHFIGINLQAVVDGNLQVVNAAVSGLHKRVKTAAILKNIVGCSTKLDILEKQIYSLTTDYESNVLKVGELMRSDFTLSKNFANQNDKGECDVG